MTKNVWEKRQDVTYNVYERRLMASPDSGQQQQHQAGLPPVEQHQPDPTEGARKGTLWQPFKRESLDADIEAGTRDVAKAARPQMGGIMSSLGQLPTVLGTVVSELLWVRMRSRIRTLILS